MEYQNSKQNRESRMSQENKLNRQHNPISDNRPEFAAQAKMIGSMQAANNSHLVQKGVYSGGKPPIQRAITTDDQSKVLLNKFNRKTECIQELASQIYSSALKKNATALFPHFDDLFDAIEEVYDEIAVKDIINADQSLAISSVLPSVIGEVHQKWMGKAKAEIPEEQQSPSHEQIALIPQLFAHYNLFDNNMIWRFTSMPSSENVYTARQTEEGTKIDYKEILRVIAAHSGGNDKSNPYVKTLSFGKNPASLMGTAASTGGDKHVLNIIDKADFLYGIDIGTLAEKGITAHPAFARAISLFESEYVLINTPGFPPINLTELATKKYNNPFKGVAMEAMGIDRKDRNIVAIEHEMKPVTPEAVADAENIPLEFAQKIAAFAMKTKKAASEQSFTVQDKEPLDPHVASNAMTKYNMSLK